MYAEWLWKCSKVGNKCNTYAVCRMFHVNKFDLLTANCWCKCRNLLMRKREMICRVKILERKKISQPNGFKKTYICETRKIKTKVVSIHFSFFLSFMYTLSRGCCHGPSCSFIIQSPSHNVIEKKIVRFTAWVNMNALMPSSQEQTFILCAQRGTNLWYFDSLLWSIRSFIRWQHINNGDTFTNKLQEKKINPV